MEKTERLDKAQWWFTLYLDALKVRDPGLLSLAPTVRFTENTQEVNLRQALWQTVSSVRYRHVVADPPSSPDPASQVLMGCRTV